MNYNLIYISGPGHSGSTLLDLLLNNHAQVQSLGEIHRLNLYARENCESCTCGQPVCQCPFWLQVEHALREQIGISSEESLLKNREMMLIPSRVSRLGTIVQKLALIIGWRQLYQWLGPVIAPAHEEAIDNALRWYDAIHSVTQCSALVESTKDARRLKMLYFRLLDRYRLIYMIRDGRAVTASSIRREGVSMQEAAYEWIDYHRRIQFAKFGIPKRQILNVRYEHLCLQPEETLRTVCQFIDVAFTSDMLQLRKQEAHNIGGNPMRFRAGEASIKLDERWREQLSKEQLETFERIGGRLNRRLGYPPL